MSLLTWSISATVCTIGTTYRKVVRTTSTTQSRTTMIRMNPANWITCNFPIFGWIHSLSYSISKHNHSICIFAHWQWFQALIHWICLGENVLGEFSHNHKDFHKILILPEICSGSPGRGFIGTSFFFTEQLRNALYILTITWNFLWIGILNCYDDKNQYEFEKHHPQAMFHSQLTKMTFDTSYDRYKSYVIWYILHLQ